MKQYHSLSRTGTSMYNNILSEIWIDNLILILLNCNEDICKIMLSFSQIQHSYQERIRDTALKYYIFICSQIYIAIQRRIFNVKLAG